MNHSDLLNFCIRNCHNIPKLLEIQAQLQKPEMISYIEQHPFQITPEIVSVAPALLSSSSLKLRFLKEDPSRIVYLPKEAFDETIISYLDSISYAPSRESYEKNPQLFSIPSLVMRSEQVYVDVMVINPFHDFDFKDIFLLEDSGYQFQEQDFIKNGNLRNNLRIMELAIKQNPSFIRFVGPNITLNGNLLKDALKEYPITKEVLEANPRLIENDSLMSYLVSKNPELKIYHLNSDRRRKFINSFLKDEKYEALLDLPFMRQPFQNRFSKDTIFPLLSFLRVKINYDDVDTQMKYQQFLNQLFLTQAEIDYQDNKYHFLYSDIASLNLAFQNAFEQNKEEELIVDLESFINQGRNVISHERMNTLVEAVKKLQQQTGNYHIPAITNIYSFLLNLHRDVYLSKRMDQMKKEVIKDLQLSNKAFEKVRMNKSIQKIVHDFQNQKWDYYGGLFYLQNELKDKRQHVSSMHKVRKNEFQFTNDVFERLEAACLNGCLSLQTVSEILNCFDKDLSVEVFRFYNRFYANLAKNDKRFSQPYVSIGDKEKIPYHYKNYKIANEEHVSYVLQSLFAKIKDKDIPQILNTFYVFPQMITLLPLVGLTSSFSIDTYYSILIHYPEITKRIATDISSKYFFETNPLIYLIGHMKKAISVANGLNEEKNEIYSLLFGKNVTNLLPSQYLPKYLNIYLKSLLRGKSSIPQISGTQGNFSYSTATTEPDCLLIGAGFAHSCIDLPNPSGASTYQGCLTKPNMDVLLIRDKFTHQIVARSILFRTKNFVMLAPFYDTKGNICDELLTHSFLDCIGSEIMKQSEKKGDSIEAVLYNCGLFVPSDLKYPIVMDSHFLFDFPHADLDISAFVLKTKESRKKPFTNLDIDITPFEQPIYERIRQPIKSKEDITEKDIQRLQILDDLLNHTIKNLVSKPIILDDFKTIFCGEDWYAGERNNGKIECSVLPTMNPKISTELIQTKLPISPFDMEHHVK